MKSAWSEDDATATVDELRARYPGRCDRQVALRIYTSRLIGREPGLVLHGGGNTSVKTTLVDDLGDLCEVLCVKGSGWDLAKIDLPGLPALRLRSLQALRQLDSLDDAAMVNAARTRLLDATAPNPSVEVLLHAFLPHTFIDHSHADAILSLVSQTDALSIIDEVFGDRLAVVPYVMPGFALAKLAAEIAEANPGCEGLLLLQHGLFTFGADARESYERHIHAITAAEAHIAHARARARARIAIPPAVQGPTDSPPKRVDAELCWTRIAPTIRGALAGDDRSYILHLRRSPAISAFVSRPPEQLLELISRGPVTPDHVIRTKQRPLLIDLNLNLNLNQKTETMRPLIEAAIAGYRSTYRAYFAHQTSSRRLDRLALDADPRVLLIPGLGLVGIGTDERAARIAADIYEHTVTVISDAQVVGRHQALPERDIFDMEYWPLEQAKLGRKKKLPLRGKVVMISGAAGGIGLACAHRFAEAGAALFLIDRNRQGLEAAGRALRNAAIWTADIGDREAVEAATRACVARFGGIDGILANAGFAAQAPIASCPQELLEDSLRVNLLGHQWLAAAATRVMLAQGVGGFLLFNASKAAFNPGKGFGPYAIAKAALIALMKQYAVEHGGDQIRSNAVNADRIRTGLLPPEVVQERAAARGLAVDDYFKSNLLGREVLAQEVAEAFLHLALATSTSGAVLTVDGGNIAASPR